MAQTIQIEQLASAVQKYLDEYGDEVLSVIDEAARKTAQNARKAVSASAPVGKNGGDYKRSWAVKTERRRTGTTATVYSKQPGLPHLLENGHATRDGGRTRAFVHIAPAEAEAVKEFESQIERLLK